MVQTPEPDREHGMKTIDLTMQELIAFMNSYENEEFIIHVEFSEEEQDE